MHRKVVHTDIKRAKVASPDEIQQWVESLGETIKQYNLKDADMANCDETGLDLQDIVKKTYGFVGESSEVLVPQDRRRVSAMVAITQTGYRFPSFFIYPGSPGTSVDPEWLEDAGPQAMGVHTESGYMDTPTFK